MAVYYDLVSEVPGLYVGTATRYRVLGAGDLGGLASSTRPVNPAAWIADSAETGDRINHAAAVISGSIAEFGGNACPWTDQYQPDHSLVPSISDSDWLLASADIYLRLAVEIRKALGNGLAWDLGKVPLLGRRGILKKADSELFTTAAISAGGVLVRLPDLSYEQIESDIESSARDISEQVTEWCGVRDVRCRINVLSYGTTTQGRLAAAIRGVLASGADAVATYMNGTNDRERGQLSLGEFAAAVREFAPAATT